MALIDCPECGGTVSDQAPSCIHCGYPLAVRRGRSVASLDVESERDLELAKLRKLRDDGALSETEWIRAQHAVLTPSDPVGIAQRAHADRIEYANNLYTEGRYTEDQYAEFRRASEAELQRDLKKAFPTQRWDIWRIVNFKSRNRRVEYWAAAAVAIGILLAGGYIAETALEGTGFFMFLCVCAWLLIFWGATVNRLHDLGQPGWWSLLGLLPIGGLVLLFWVGTQKGQAGPNRWGPPVA